MGKWREMRVLAKDKYDMASRRREGPTLFKITLPLGELRPASQPETVATVVRRGKDISENASLGQRLTREDAASPSPGSGARSRSMMGDF